MRTFLLLHITSVAACLWLVSCASDNPPGYQSRADFSREWCARNGVKFVRRASDEEHPVSDKVLAVVRAPFAVAGYATYGLFWALAEAGAGAGR